MEWPGAKTSGSAVEASTCIATDATDVTENVSIGRSEAVEVYSRTATGTTGATGIWP